MLRASNRTGLVDQSEAVKVSKTESAVVHITREMASRFQAKDSSSSTSLRLQTLATCATTWAAEGLRLAPCTTRLLFRSRNEWAKINEINDLSVSDQINSFTTAILPISDDYLIDSKIVTELISALVLLLSDK